MDKYVEIGGRRALTSPNFVIFHEGRYYVTVAVLEFDPNAGGDAAEGVAAVRNMFESAQQAQGSVGLESAAAAPPAPAPQAHKLDQDWGWTEQSSDPPPRV